MQFRPTQVVTDRPGKSHLWLAGGVLLVASVLVLSFLPPHTKVAIHTKGRLHYVGHFLIFAAIGFVFVRAARSTWERLGALLLALGLGPLIEWTEARTYKCPMEWRDVLVDFLAVLLAAAIVLLPTEW